LKRVSMRIILIIVIASIYRRIVAFPG